MEQEKKQHNNNLLANRLMVGFTDSEIALCKEAHKKLNPGHSLSKSIHDVFIEFSKANQHEQNN